MSALRTEEFMKSTGPVHQLIAKTPDWRGATLARLREIVRDADPAMVEDVKWRRSSNPNGCAVWQLDGIVCAGIILKERVRLSFFAGSSLPDPAKLFNAQLKGKSRAIDFWQDGEIDRRAPTALIRSAVPHNLPKAGPPSAAPRPTARTRRPRRTIRRGGRASVPRYALRGVGEAGRGSSRRRRHRHHRESHGAVSRHLPAADRR